MQREELQRHRKCQQRDAKQSHRDTKQTGGNKLVKNRQHENREKQNNQNS